MSSEKKQKVDTEKTNWEPRTMGYLGQCVKCRHVGLVHVACQQCGENMSLLYDRTDLYFRRMREDEYQLCVTIGCDNAEKCLEKDRPCLRCMESGINSKMVYPIEEELAVLKKQKYLPRCAQITYNKCMKCFDAATYFGEQLPRSIMMASSILKLTREYDALVENGYKVTCDKNEYKDTKILLKPTTLDISPKQLRTLIEHHHKMCLCAICKWLIICDNKQDEL